MYWVYLITFTFTVFVPILVQEGHLIFNLAQTQSITIFILGSVGFIIFLIMENISNKHLLDKSRYLKQVTRMSKDLTQSYSYIGEINRKLDILENIAVGYPESIELTQKNESEVYDSIMGAIQVFGRTDFFSLKFISKPDLEIVQEINSVPEFNVDFSTKDIEDGKSYNEKEGCIIITSPKAIEDTFACIVIKKNQSSHRIEDREMMKTLASQALFLFVFMKHRRQIKCII